MFDGIKIDGTKKDQAEDAFCVFARATDARDVGMHTLMSHILLIFSMVTNTRVGDL